jgi:hypothetical protein
MSASARVTDRLEQVVSMMGRAVEAALLAGVLVVVLCGMGIVAAATFAILHPGDDLGNFGGGGSEGGGDLIAPYIVG